MPTSYLDFSPSGDVAQRLGHAFQDSAREFCDLPRAGRRGKSVVRPDVAPDPGQGIGAGRIARAIPGGLTDHTNRSRHLGGVARGVEAPAGYPRDRMAPGAAGGQDRQRPGPPALPPWRWRARTGSREMPWAAARRRARRRSSGQGGSASSLLRAARRRAYPPPVPTGERRAKRLSAGRRPSEQGGFHPFVASEPGGALELDLRFGQPAGPEQNVSPGRWQRGVVA